MSARLEALLAALVHLLALMALVQGLAWAVPWAMPLWAAPVPEVAPVEGVGSRGRPELRFPGGRQAETPSRLLRACANCHGGSDYNCAWNRMRYFNRDGTVHLYNPPYDNRWRLRDIEEEVALATQTGHLHLFLDKDPVPLSSDDRADLQRALRLLQTQGLESFRR